MKDRNQKRPKIRMDLILWWEIISLTLLAVTCIAMAVGVHTLNKQLLGMRNTIDSLRVMLDQVPQEWEVEYRTNEIMIEYEILDVVEPSPTVEEYYTPTEEELEILAKILYREARGIKDQAHQAAVVWCILNRVDNGYWGDTIKEVATYPGQFAWVPDTPVLNNLLELSEDVVSRWNREKAGETNVGRVLPSSYLFFAGDGEQNHFREEYLGSILWDWSLPSPY